MMRRLCKLIALIPLIAGLAAAMPATAAATAIGLSIDGPIGPASSQYVEQGLQAAREQQAHLVILRIDTPGGLDQAMRDIVQAILASPVPVVGYVAPGGARAASAGTYILYATHIAAMTPATNLGAATPVSIGGGLPGEEEPKPQAGEEKPAADGADASDSDSAKRRKVVNDAVAYLRGLAERRERNAEWAEKAVRDGASLSAQQALEMNVIDLIADNRESLLEQINGRSVETTTGKQTLDTQGISVEQREPDWRMRLLAVITNPSVAYILMMIGMYGLILEGYNPGALVPGVIGAICLLLALFAFQILPINYAGFALLALGIALMVAEAFAPSFGVLGLGGVAAFVFGSIIMFDTGVPGYEVPLAIISALGAASGLLMFLIVALFARSHNKRVVTGHEGMVGAHAEVLEGFHGQGAVHVHGERWQAVSDQPLRAGQRVRVTRREGLTLTVKPADD